MGLLTKLFARADATMPGPSCTAKDRHRLGLILLPAVLRMAQCDKDSAEQANALMQAALGMKIFADRACHRADAALDLAILVSAAFVSARGTDTRSAMAKVTNELGLDDRKLAIHLALKGAMLLPKREIWDIGFLSGLAGMLGQNDAEFGTIFDTVRHEIASP